MQRGTKEKHVPCVVKRYTEVYLKEHPLNPKAAPERKEAGGPQPIGVGERQGKARK